MVPSIDESMQHLVERVQPATAYEICPLVIIVFQRCSDKEIRPAAKISIRVDEIYATFCNASKLDDLPTILYDPSNVPSSSTVLRRVDFHVTCATSTSSCILDLPRLQYLLNHIASAEPETDVNLAGAGLDPLVTAPRDWVRLQDAYEDVRLFVAFEVPLLHDVGHLRHDWNLLGPKTCLCQWVSPGIGKIVKANEALAATDWCREDLKDVPLSTCTLKSHVLKLSVMEMLMLLILFASSTSITE